MTDPPCDPATAKPMRWHHLYDYDTKKILHMKCSGKNCGMCKALEQARERFTYVDDTA